MVGLKRNCPFCGTESIIETKKILTQWGMLEDIPGYSKAEFRCPECGYFARESGPEDIDMNKLIREVDMRLETKDPRAEMIGNLVIQNKDKLSVQFLKDVLQLLEAGL